MAAKLLRTMSSDDNSDVPKHIGCMAGIFQLFGRGHFLSRRHISKRQLPAAEGNNNTSSTTSTTHNNQSSVPTNPPKPTNPVQKVVKDSILYRDVRGISVKRGSSTKQESTGTLTYIDSPRPSLPSPKSTKSKLYGFRESLPQPADSRFLHRKESPRFSYDGSRESKPSCFKIKELPRYSLDSKRPTTTPPLSEDEDGTRSHRRQPSIVAKLMGLEDLENQLDPMSQQEYDPISRPVDKKSTVPNSRKLELAPWKRPELGTTVYGQIEKRLSQLEFQKSGKDLRALKQILQAMQNCEPKKLQSDDDTLLNSGPTINRIVGSPPPLTKKKQSKPPTFAIKPIKKAEPSSVVPVPGLRKLDLGDMKRVQKKQSQPSLESRSPRQQKTNSPESAKRIINQSRQAKSKSKPKPKGGSNGSDNFSGCGDLTEQSNSISVQSDSINSQEEMEVSSPYRQDRKKMASKKIREEDFISKSHTPEQPSPVSVLDAFDDEPPSPVRMIKRDVKPLNDNKTLERNSPKFTSTRTDHNSSLGVMDLSPVKPIQHDKEINKSHNYGYISEILLASGLLNGAKSKYTDEIQKRLVSDVVNELLIEKMTSNRSVTQQKQLLKTLCSEIEELPCKLEEEDDDCFRKMLEKDLGRRSMEWKRGFGDSSGIVVDMERMIFRDLICEMVSIEAMDLQARYVKSRRRQLFQN